MATRRVAIDIGGTFTDLVLEDGARTNTRKVLTTPRAPEEGVMTGLREILAEAGLRAGDLVTTGAWIALPARPGDLVEVEFDGLAPAVLRIEP